MLGGDKARRRDLSDTLATASAAFLGTGSVKEGFAELMAREAAKGPGRLEKIDVRFENIKKIQKSFLNCYFDKSSTGKVLVMGF